MYDMGKIKKKLETDRLCSSLCTADKENLRCGKNSLYTQYWTLN